MSRARKALLLLLVLLALPIVALLVVYTYLVTPAGNAMLRAQATTLVSAMMDEGRLEIDGLDTNLLRHTRVEGLRLLDGEGRVVIGIDSADLNYRLWPLLTERTLVVSLVTLDGPAVDLRVDADGVLDLSRMFPSSDEPSSGSGLPFTIQVDEARLSDGQVGYALPEQGWAAEALSVTLKARAWGNTYVVDDILLSGNMREPEAGELGLAGDVTWDDGDLTLAGLALRLGEAARLHVDAQGEALTGEAARLTATVGVERLDLDALEALTGDIGLNGVTEGLLSAEGPLSALVVTPSLRLGAGEVGGELTVDLTDPRFAWSAALDLTNVDAEALLDAVTEPTRLNARVEAEGGGITWPDDLEAKGTVRLADSVTWGYLLPEATATVEWVGGSGQLTGVRYQSGFGRVVGDGRVTDTSVDLDLVARVWDLGGLEEFGAANLEGDAEARGHLHVEWGGEVPLVTFEGDAKGGALGYIDVFTAGVWSTPVNMRWDGDTWVQGEAELSSLDAYGVNAQLVRGPWTVEVLADSSVTWDVPELGLEDVSAFGGRIGAIVGTVDGGIDPKGFLRTDVGVYLNALGYRSLEAQAGTATVTLDGDALGMDVDLYRGEETVVMIDGQADLASAEYRFSTLQLGAPGPGSWRNQGDVSFILEGAGVRDAAIDLRSTVGEVRLTGLVGAEGPLDGTLEVKALDMGWLASILPEELAGWDGQVSADLTLAGASTALEARGRVRADALVIPEQLDRLSAVADVDLDGQTFTFDADLSAPGPKGAAQQLGAARGVIPVHADLNDFALDARSEATLEALVYPVDFALLAAALPPLAGSLTTEDGPLPGELSATMTVRGPLVDPRLEVDAGVYLPVGEAQAWMRADLSVVADDGLVTLSGGAWERGQRRLELSGDAHTSLQDILVWAFEDGPEPALSDPSTYVNDLAIRAVPLAVPVSTLAAFVELPENLDGRVSGALQVTGDPRHPKLGGGLQILDGKLGEVALAPAVLGVQPGEGGYTVFGTLGFSEDPEEIGQTTLDFSGWVPFTYNLDSDYDLKTELAREGLDIQVSGTGVPFATLSVVDPAIEDGEGIIRIAGSISGSLATPLPDLEVSMDEGYFRYRDIGVAFEAVKLRGRVQRDQLTLQHLGFKTVAERTFYEQTFNTLKGKDIGVARQGCGATFKPPLRSGEVRISGTSKLEDLDLGDVDFDICAYEAYFSAVPELIVQVTAEMGMTGPWPNVLVEGDVVADNVFYSMDEADFFGGGGLSLDPALKIVREGGASQYSQRKPDNPFYWPFDIQLNIDLARKASLDVTVPLLDTYDALGLSTMRLKDSVIDGVIDFRMHEDDLEIVGEVRTRRGTVTVMSEDFSLDDESTITFSGQEYTNPSLDITATHDAGSYGNIEVQISHSAVAPQIEFVSDAGYSITDVLSILLIGRPTTDLGQAGSGALGDISAFLTSQAAGALTDQFEVFGGGNLVDSFQLAGDDSAVISTVKVGTTVGKQGYIELELNRDPDEDEAPTEVTFEYVLTRRLEGVLHVGGENSADLYANWRF